MTQDGLSESAYKLVDYLRIVGERGDTAPFPRASQRTPMAPRLDRIDHIHVFVSDRAEAERWYADILGCTRIKKLEFWAADGGPLTLADSSGSIHLALFEQPPQKCRSTIAFATSAGQFLEWRKHLAERLGRSVAAVDHQLAWSLYFSDPDGNPFEVTCYDYAAVAGRLREAEAA